MISLLKPTRGTGAYLPDIERESWYIEEDEGMFLSSLALSIPEYMQEAIVEERNSYQEHRRLMSSPVHRGTTGATTVLVTGVPRRTLIMPVAALAEAADTTYPASANATDMKAAALGWIKEATGMTDVEVGALLGVERMTIYRWMRGGSASAESERRIHTVRALLELAQKQHQTPEHLRAWLKTPRNPDWRTPEQVIAAGEFDRARGLAISWPSGKLIQSLGSADLPESLLARTEYRRQAVSEPIEHTQDDEELSALFGLLDDEEESE